MSWNWLILWHIALLFNSIRTFPTTNHRTQLFSAKLPGTFEGDISTGGLTDEEFYWTIIDRTPPVERKIAQTVLGEGRKWPGGIIPYQFAPRTSQMLKKTWKRAVEYLQNETCVKFLPKTNKDSIFVTVSSDLAGCGVSDIGRLADGRNQLKIGSICENSLIDVIHEMMHTLGFVHEQSRPDRDDFVRILPQNVRPFADINFQKYIPVAVDIYEFAYDYFSIMHYPENAFSTQEKELSTIVPKRKVPIGQNVFVSKQDLARINHHYGCDNPYRAYNKSCPVATQFRCKFVDGCIDAKNVCDGLNDCGDFSDEKDCKPAVNENTKCPDGWTSATDACYKFIGLADFTKAKSICQSFPVPDSPNWSNTKPTLPVFRHEKDFTEFIEIIETFEMVPNFYVYLGGRDQNGNGTWVVEQQCPFGVCKFEEAPLETDDPDSSVNINRRHCLAPYSNWSWQEPNNFMGGSQRCLARGVLNGMYDVPCDLSAQYLVCQLPLFQICDYVDIQNKERAIELAVHAKNITNAPWLDSCLFCLCDAITPGCNWSTPCSGGGFPGDTFGLSPCGPFQISYYQYELLMEGEYEGYLDRKEYFRCTTDKNCTYDLLKRDLLKHGPACVGRGRDVDCEMMIRLFGHDLPDCPSINSLPLFYSVKNCMDDYVKFPLTS